MSETEGPARSDVMKAIDNHLDDLREQRVPARKKPTALQYGLLNAARTEIAHLRTEGERKDALIRGLCEWIREPDGECGCHLLCFDEGGCIVCEAEAVVPPLVPVSGTQEPSGE